MLWNKEIRSCVILYLIIAAVSAAVGFMLGTASGVLAVLLSAALGTVFFVFS